MKYFLTIVVLFVAILTFAEAQVEQRLEFILYSKYWSVELLQILFSDFISPSRNAEKVYKVSDFATILSNPNFNQTKSTVFFFYGFSQSKSSSGVVTLKNAYLTNNGYNFIIVSIDTILYNVMVRNPIFFSF